MDLRDWGAVGQFLSGLGAATIAVTAVVAAIRYRHQVSLERTKWLQQLYESFYTSDRYKGVRQLIDFEDTESLFQLLKKGDSAPRELRPAERDQIDQFTDYLNFFEWIGYLVKNRKITFEQVDIMFKYYLVRPMQGDNSQEFRKYVKKHGYEKLHDLLNYYSKIGDS